MHRKTRLQVTGVGEDGDIVALEGWQALINLDHAQPRYCMRTKGLHDLDIFVPTAPNRLLIAAPDAFNSPSPVAAFALDRNRHGRIEWRVEGSTQSYREWQQARIAVDRVSA